MVPTAPDATRSPLQDFQFAFTRYLRDPRHAPRPAGMAQAGARLYQTLLRANMEAFLLACFPVMRAVIGARRWRALMQDFLAEHVCQTPYYREIPDEFLAYLHGPRAPRPTDPPFLYELAHYEWSELVLAVSGEPIIDPIDPQGDLMTGVPVMNPVLALSEYAYPVHRIGRRYKPTAPSTPPTYMLAFRNAADGVRFICLNASTMALLAVLMDGTRSGQAAIGAALRTPPSQLPSAALAGGQAILEDLRHEQAIIGTRLTAAVHAH
ncbi:MAG: HvfC family RiPP maturation protein [Acidiferrobacter sp.]